MSIGAAATTVTRRPGSSLSTGVVIAIAVGGAIALAVTLYLLRKWRRSQSRLAVQLEEADRLGIWVLDTLLAALGVSTPPAASAPQPRPKASGLAPVAASAAAAAAPTSTSANAAQAVAAPAVMSNPGVPRIPRRRRATATGPAAAATPASAPRPAPSYDALQGWVNYQYTQLLKHLTKQSDRYTSGHLATGLVVIAGGFATSGVAVAAGSGKGGSTAWLIFGLGLAVALAGGAGQIFRLAQRSGGFGQLADSLRAEGWALVNGHDDYSPAEIEKKQGSTAFDVFDANVSSIRRRATELASIEAPSAGARKKGTGGR